MSRSLNIQTLIDPCQVADMVRLFQAHNIPHRSSYSHLIHEILRATWETWDCAHFTDPEQALAYLSNQGFSISQLKQPKRGARLLSHLQKAQLDPIQPSVLSTDSPPSPIRADEISNLLQPEA